MNKGIGLFVGITAFFAMGSTHAQAICPATPVNEGINVATGHIFEIYASAEIDWVDAKSCAESKFQSDSYGNPVYGHLATITSSSEDAYVNGLKRDDLDGADGTRALAGEVWVGGSQVPDAPNAYTGWRWENGEGVISVPGLTPGPDYYSNWAPSPPAPTPEPNDYYGAGSENYLAIGLYSPATGWNDEGGPGVGNIKGFIVEYDTPRTSGDCDGTTTEACTTVEGQTLTFPPGAFDQTDGNITFSAYEFKDPRVGPDNKCTSERKQLKLFRVEDGFEPGEELRIPAYLCGSPDFVVVKVNSDALSDVALDAILRGAVLVKNETDVILPGNEYKCFDPLVTPPLTTPYFPDPQYQDVVVWQSTDPTRMLEDRTTTTTTTPTTPTPRVDYVGAATEATNGCGSTTAKVRGASYFVVGMHIDFGNATYDYASSSLQNYQQFVALTRYKLLLLQQSVADSRTYGSVTKPDWQAMSSHVKNAIRKLDGGDPAGALSAIYSFLFKVNSSTYSDATGLQLGFNYNGDHLMRGENIAFTLRVKVVPFKPVP